MAIVITIYKLDRVLVPIYFYQIPNPNSTQIKLNFLLIQTKKEKKNQTTQKYTVLSGHSEEELPEVVALMEPDLQNFWLNSQATLICVKVRISHISGNYCFHCISEVHLQKKNWMWKFVSVISISAKVMWWLHWLYFVGRQHGAAHRAHKKSTCKSM